jgi:hypothetical protein
MPHWSLSWVRWKPSCIRPGRKCCRSSLKSIPGATAATVGYPTTVELIRVSLGEARARVAAAAEVLPRCGLNGVPVEPKLPATAAAVAEHAIGPADVTVIRSILGPELLTWCDRS